MNGFWEEMERLGKDRNPYRAGFLQFVGVAETRERGARALPRAGRVLLRPLPARRPALRVAARLHRARRRSARACSRRWRRPPRRRARASARLRRPALRGDRRAGLRDHRQPRRSRRAAARGGVELNVGQLMLLLQFGNMNRDLALYNTELFAKRVMPQLAGLFEDEWENRWWPKPLAAARARACRGRADAMTWPGERTRHAVARRAGRRVLGAGTGEPLGVLGGLARAAALDAVSRRARARASRDRAVAAGLSGRARASASSTTSPTG